MATLYRAYRPRTFGEVFGQEHITETLERAVTTDRLTHAYLFHGPRGTGKTTMARILARRVNCMKPKGPEPCGRCVSCKAMDENSQVDVLEIDAASNRGIDDIRALRERIGSAPTMSTYKIYIVDEVHMLTNEAATALLKTLEEPVAHAIFVLATTELHKVLPTILSRCQVYRFRRASDKEMGERLRYLLKKEKRSVADEVLTFVVERADGCYRDGESLLGQVLTWKKGKISREDVTAFLGLPASELMDRFLNGMVAGESAPTLEALDEAFSQGVDPEQFLKESVRKARDKALLSDDFARWSMVIRALVQAVQDLAYVPQPLLAIHVAILSTCTTKGSDDQGSRKATGDMNMSSSKDKDVPQSNGAKSNESRVDVSKAQKSEGKPAEVTAVTSSSPEKSKNIGTAVGLEEVAKRWNELVAIVKEKNPVASTFLRTMVPTTVTEGQVHLRAQYALHKSYFENVSYRAMVTDALGELLESKVTIAIEVAEKGDQVGAESASDTKETEEVFLKNVKEVFA